MGSSTYQGGSHLTFTKMSLIRKEKLNRYKVINHVKGEKIGEIHWRGGWRQYVFQAKPDIDMSRSCMKEVIDYIEHLMKIWRQNKFKEKQNQENGK